MDAAAQALERYLHQHIPLSHAMQLTVVSVGAEQVVLAAPLAPNINHRETLFGGSASAIAILAAWSLVHTRLAREGFKPRLVIQSNTMHYDHPVVGEFTATSFLQASDAWGAFVHVLRRRGRARIRVAATLDCAGVRAARFEGEFVALRAPPS